MGVYLLIIGKHSIPFKDKRIENESKFLCLLNSLKLEDSKFLKDSCQEWFSKPHRDKDEVEKYLKMRSWNFDDFFEDYEDPINRFFLEGPYGLLSLSLNEYFFELMPCTGSYLHWFNAYENFDILSREKWRLIVYKIMNILGGNYVMYFPDNMLDLDEYSPRNYDFPKEMSEYFQAKINDLDDLIELISCRYSKPLTLVEADKAFNNLDKNPFVIDRFEDLNKDLKI